MELLTPKALFDLYSLLSNESKFIFHKLVASEASMHIPLFIAANLCESEKECFGQFFFKKNVELLMPFLISKAVEVVRSNQEKNNDELARLLVNSVRDFGERFVGEAVAQATKTLKTKRDRKSDPDIIRRNVNICDLRKQDRKKWSLLKLAKHFKKDKRTITGILEEESKWRKMADKLGGN